MNLSDSAFKARPRKRTEGRTTGAAARRVHLVVVQLLFSEDGLLVPHGGRGGVSRPLGRRFPSAASGAPSPAPAALASLAAGSVASLAWPARLRPAIQWEGRRGRGEGGAWAGLEQGAGLRLGRGQGRAWDGAGPEASLGRRRAWGRRRRSLRPV